MSRENDSFKSHIGVMVAIIGSAIGFGNFWRFPYLTGENGGGAFITVYIIIALCLGIPLIASEYIIGKTTHKDFIGAIKELGNGKKWYFIGYLTQLTVLLITSFYCVIGGWTLHALIDSVQNFSVVRDAETIKETFGTFVNSGWTSIVLTAIFLGISCHVVSRGIHNGTEKFNKVLIPTLFCVLIAMCIYSFTLPGFTSSLDFLFHPDFSQISASTVLSAFGQVFFSMSVGMGIYATYASYSHKEENILQDQAIIVLSDTFVAILAGIIIFSAVFSFNINPSEGPSLIFIALPALFSQMPLGNIIAILFYISLAIAALTSAISLVEVMVTGLVDQFKIGRKKSCLIILFVEIALATTCALSQTDWIKIEIAGLNFFDFLDTITANWMLTIACLMTSIFMGWVADKKRIKDAITSNGKRTGWFYGPYIFILKYFVPAMVLILVISKTIS